MHILPVILIVDLVLTECPHHAFSQKIFYIAFNAYLSAWIASARGT